MVDCHVCGGEAIADAFVEGVKVPLCRDCLRYGARPEYYSRETAKRFSAPAPERKRERKPIVTRRVVDGYAKTISEARKARGWTRLQLAKKSGVAESEITAFEDERLHPDVKSAEKLEHALKIRLLKEIEEEPHFSLASRETSGEGVSLGDLVDFKKS